MSKRARIALAVAGTVAIGGGIAAVVLARGGEPAARARVLLTVRAPELDAGAVEAQVAIPLEHALRNAPWARSLRSRSRRGVAELTVELADGASLDAAALAPFLQVLPRAAALPELRRLDPAARPWLYTLESGTHPLPELRRLHDQAVAPALLRLAGAQSLRTCDGPKSETQVRLDPARLAAMRLSLREVADALRATADTSPEHLGTLALGTREVPLRLSDVAQIAVASSPPSCFARRNGRRVIAGEVRSPARVPLETIARELPAGVRLLPFPAEPVAAARLALVRGARPERRLEWARRAMEVLRVAGAAEVLARVRGDELHFLVSPPPSHARLVELLQRALPGAAPTFASLDDPDFRTAVFWLRGDDRAALLRAYPHALAALSKGSAGASAALRPRIAEIAPVIDSAAALRFGVRVPDIEAQLAALGEGLRVRDGLRLFLGRAEGTPEALRESLVQSADGRAISLSSIVAWKTAAEPDTDLERFDGRPAIRLAAIVRRDEWDDYRRQAPERVRAAVPAGMDLQGPEPDAEE